MQDYDPFAIIRIAPRLPNSSRGELSTKGKPQPQNSAARQSEQLISKQRLLARDILKTLLPGIARRQHQQNDANVIAEVGERLINNAVAAVPQLSELTLNVIKLAEEGCEAITIMQLLGKSETEIHYALASAYVNLGLRKSVSKGLKRPALFAIWRAFVVRHAR